MDPLVTLGDQLFDAALRERAATSARRRWRRSRPLAVLVAGVLLAGGAASAAVLLSSRASAPLVGALGPSEYAIDVSPYLNAGQSGWCAGVIATEQRRFRGWSEGCGGTPGAPIVAESYVAAEAHHATLNWAITMGSVAAVRFGRNVVRTRSDPRLPAGFRAAVEIVAPGRTPGRGSQREVVRLHRTHGGILIVSRPRTVEALDARGSVIHGVTALHSAAPRPVHGGSAQPHLQKTVYWAPPQAPPDRPCAIHSGQLPGPQPQWGNVATRIHRVGGVPGSAFISCADTEFYWQHWPLEAAVLLNAAHPGAEPAAFPQLQPVPDHPGVFDAPGGVQGHFTGRRMDGAWLVVQGGKDLSQRLALLNALTVVSPAALWR
jgi:hypothetical protein